jgi:DNA-binding LacI/PurR family transcriptional regulator
VTILARRRGWRCYDDSRFGRLPGIDLTSVRQDIPKMARLAVKAVVERLDRPTRKPRTLTLRPKLVVRGTTAAPRSADARSSRACQRLTRR